MRASVTVSERAREATIQRAIMAAIGAMPGVVVHRNNVGTATHGGARVEYGVGGKGAPDLLVEVLCGDLWRVLWIEVKTPEGTVEPHQRAWHEAARRMGRPCVVARSVEDACRAVETVRCGGAP